MAKAYAYLILDDTRANSFIAGVRKFGEFKPHRQL